MKLSIVIAGKVRGNLREVMADYLKRIGHYAQIEYIEIKTEQKRKLKEKSNNREPGLKRAIERGRHPNQRLVALDANGERMTSEAFAAFLGRLRDEGQDLCFQIGGASGLPESVLTRADCRLSLSQLTFPHQFVPLLLAEQLYRAFTILRGEPYHK